ncbi:MAG: stage III sporulation protein AF, partial [Clostridiales bacterium]|nr:stage III sporulation protein AF [Clostridiales bacterium]
MVTNLLVWIKQLICLVVLFRMALQMMPNGTYRKYIRFFAGMILIVAMMQPLISLAGEDECEETLFSQLDEVGDEVPDFSGME